MADAHAALHEQVIDSLASGIVTVGPDGAVVLANRAACAHLGLDPQQLRPGLLIADSPQIKHMAALFEEVAATRRPLSRREITLTLDDGASKEIGLSATPLEGTEGLAGVVFLFTDMTERRKIERAAELNRQLAALGELTAGVVHEIRNPLSVISAMSELLMRKLGPDDPRTASVETIFKEAANIEKSISLFLGFARPYDVTPARCAPDAIVERAVQLCARRAQKKEVALETVLEPGLPEMQADVGRTAQALANIVNNGIDAAGPGGRVVLTVTRRHDDIRFEIDDTGPGIQAPPDEDLFKPFYTRKEGGTGLGLAIVHRIITAHGGSVRYSNRDEGGAHFEVSLPIGVVARR